MYGASRMNVMPMICIVMFIFFGYQMIFHPEQSLKKINPLYTKESQIKCQKRIGILSWIAAAPLLLYGILRIAKIVTENIMMIANIGSMVLLVIVIVAMIVIRKVTLVPVDKKGTKKAKQSKQDEEF